MAVYELVAVARTPRPGGPPTLTEVGPIVAPTLTWTDELNGPGKLQFSCQADRLSDDVQLRLRDLLSRPTEVWLYRDGVKVFAGPLMGYQVQAGTVSATAPGLAGYLGYMQVAYDLAFAAVDQFSIARTLVDQWQELGYGHYGIDTSAAALSGIVRDRTYLAAEQHQVLRRLQQLADVQGGFDWWVDPATRALELAYPSRGVDLTGAVVLDARNITDGALVVSVAPGDVASHAYGLGTSTDQPALRSVVSDSVIAAAFGRAGVAATFDGVTVQATLDDHTARLLADRDSQLLQPAAGLIPVADVDVDSFAPGDTVAYSFDPGLGLVEVDRRVHARQVSVDESGSETVSVVFS